MKRFGILLTPLRRFFSPRYMIRREEMLADDFRTGQMYRVFRDIAWPSLVESVLIGLITFADTLMVSTVGEEAIAAVGLTNQPRFLFFAVLFSLSVAVNAVAARRRGQGDREGANRVLEQSLPIVFLAATVFFVVATLVAEPLLRFAGAKDDTIGDAVPYFRIIMLGLIFTSVSMTLNAAQRGCGKTRISMTTNLAANVVNLALNALLINGLFFFPRLGVTGAAIATLCGNFTAMMISIISVRRRNGYLFLRFRRLFLFKHDCLPPVFKVASGSMFEQLFLRIGFFVYAKLVAELGTSAFAAHQIGMTVLNLTFTLGDGLAVATSSLVGQHLGMKRRDKAFVYGKIAQRIGWVFAVVIFVCYITLRRQIIGLFTDDPGILDDGMRIMVLLAFAMAAQIQQVLFAGCLRGAGDTRYMALVSLITVGVVRPGLAYIFCYPLGFGVIGAWMSLLIDQYLRCLFSAVRFFGQKWCRVEL